MSPEQNELEDNLNELLSTVTNEDDAENLRPYKIIKPDPGMFLFFLLHVEIDCRFVVCYFVSSHFRNRPTIVTVCEFIGFT